MTQQWTKEQAWNWYNSQPWIRGFNYVASDCVNRMEQWQEYEHEKKVVTFEREFALAQENGFNAIRSVLPFEPWYYEHDGFMKRLDNFLTLAHKYGLGVMIVFGNDCTVPKGMYTEPKFGPQPVDWGYHGGVRRSPHGVIGSHGYSLLDEPELAAAWTDMVGEIVGEFGHDGRVQIWDIFNEPGNGKRGDMSLSHMERFFERARSKDPIQPLTAGPWTITDRDIGTLPKIQRRALELSDVISYHDYAEIETSVTILSFLKTLGRPVLNTEWLNRIQHNDVRTHLPMFYLERVGIYNWGFVAGKSQTYEPWNITWTNYDNGKTDYDFTKWQHDLFRPNHRPYDPKEIELFQFYGKLADEDFKRGYTEAK